MHNWLTAKIVAKQQEATDIVSLILADPSGQPLPSFTAGSHIDVQLSSQLIRQYSLFNAPGESRYRIAVLRETASRGGSEAMHNLVEGSLINISQPRNSFALDSNAKRSLLIAGGIGITPLLSMAEYLSQTQSEFHLHYCARSLDRMPFINYIKQTPFARQVSLHLDNGSFAQKLVPERELATFDELTHLYVCGPQGFMTWIVDTAVRTGWPINQIHQEYFSAKPLTATDAAFEVQINSTGAVLLIEPEQRIADVLRANGVYIPTSCEQGICGTCLTNVIDGIPDHRDAFLTEGEKDANKLIMPCCSRSKSPRLILDL
jgi:vanillate O-demethylase ferredoxin subunit